MLKKSLIQSILYIYFFQCIKALCIELPSKECLQMKSLYCNIDLIIATVYYILEYVFVKLSYHKFNRLGGFLT